MGYAKNTEATTLNGVLEALIDIVGGVLPGRAVSSAIISTGADGLSAALDLGDKTITAQIFNTATSQNTLITAAKAVPGRLKIAVRWTPGAHRLVASNGGSGTSAAANALEVRPSLMIGGNQSALSNLNDTLRSLTVLRAPSDAEMDAWVAA